MVGNTRGRGPEHRGRRGANAVEFALILPIYCAIMSGIFDYGWMFYYKSAMDSAVAYGCRQGSVVDPGLSEVDMPTVLVTAEAQMKAGITQYGATCDGTCVSSAEVYGTNPARSIKCGLTREWNPLFGFWTHGITLQSTTVMRLEWQR